MNEHGTTGDLGWMDRLVELHVLADHGDDAALAEAHQWMINDATARAAWEAVATTCRQLTQDVDPEQAGPATSDHGERRTVQRDRGAGRCGGGPVRS